MATTLALRFRGSLLVAVLCVECIAAASSKCEDDPLSQSFITVDVTGGYSNVKSSHTEFKCVEGKVVAESRTSFWRVEAPQEQTRGVVRRDEYVSAWKRLGELGVWELTDQEYSGEDFLTYTIGVGTRNRTHRFKVQNPRDQEDRRYSEVVEEVMQLVEKIE